MKNCILTLTVIITLCIVACHTSKKSKTSSVVTKPVDTTIPAETPPSPTIVVAAKPKNGVYEPGNEELVAIQAQYKDETLEKLKQGYQIYAKGACTNCHGVENIYKFKEAEWKSICDDMSEKAALTAVQKEAVYKYVLAIKYANPREFR